MLSQQEEREGENITTTVKNQELFSDWLSLPHLLLLSSDGIDNIGQKLILFFLAQILVTLAENMLWKMAASRGPLTFFSLPHT